MNNNNNNTGKYLSIYCYNKLCLSLINLFQCSNYSMTDDMYNHLANLMAGINCTITHIIQSRAEIFNSGKSTISIGANKKMC